MNRWKTIRRKRLPYERPISDPKRLRDAYMDGHMAGRRGDRLIDRDNPFEPEGRDKYLYWQWQEGFRDAQEY